MAPDPRRSALRAAVFLMVPTLLVHAMPGPEPARAQSSQPRAGGAAKPETQVRYGSKGLPGPVLEMREAILAAVRSGRIEDLVTAIELNEIKPMFADAPLADPIGHLKQASADGEGREILAAIAAILDAGWVALPLGRDIENNRVYVWPHFAETGVASLSPAREVELYRLVPHAEVRKMREAGRYNSWRIGIGADGVWHYLRK